MQETENLKLKKFDYTDDADIEVINENMDKIDDAIANKVSLNDVITTPIPVSVKLNSVELIDNFYNNYSVNLNNTTSYKVTVMHDVPHPVFGGGTYFLEGFKTNNLYEIQTTKIYYTFGMGEFKRSKNNGVWTEWVNTSTNVPIPWINGTLQNGWVRYSSAYNTFGYYKDNFGRVYLRGVIKDGSVANGAGIATLPVEYRPPLHKMFVTISREGTTNRLPTEIVVSSAGAISIYGAGNSYLSLDGISFMT